MPPEKHSDNSEEMNDRIRRFLNSIPKNDDDFLEYNDDDTKRRKPKQKVKDILIMTGIKTFTKKYPQIQKTELFQTTMDEMLVHYTKFSKSNRCDIDDDNLNYMLNYFEITEEYEKCKVIFDML
jgi:hypothetical protein